MGTCMHRHGRIPGVPRSLTGACHASMQHMGGASW